jgi:hypothetical protein
MGSGSLYFGFVTSRRGPHWEHREIRTVLAAASSSFPVLAFVVLLGQVNMLQGSLVTSFFENMKYEPFECRAVALDDKTSWYESKCDRSVCLVNSLADSHQRRQEAVRSLVLESRPILFLLQPHNRLALRAKTLLSGVPPCYVPALLTLSLELLNVPTNAVSAAIHPW